MSDEILLWASFVLIALATHLPRSSFIVLGARVALPSVVQRALRYAPAAALAAIVAPDIFVVSGEIQPFNPKLLAAALAVAVGLRWRNPWLPFVAGMGSLLAIRFGLGWG